MNRFLLTFFIGFQMLSSQVMSNEQDIEQTLILAEQGDDDAEKRIAEIYSAGIGKQADAIDAVEWFRKAINYSNANSKDKGTASFVRTTILCRYSDLQESIVFWRDVMGFDYEGDPNPVTGTSSLLGWDKDAVRYFTKINSVGGSTVALLMVEDDDYPKLDLPEIGNALGGVVFVHMAKNIKAIYNRAIENDVEIVKPFGPSTTGRSIQIFLRAPTGHFIEVYETFM